MFSLLEGEVEFTFRGQRQTVRAGQTVNIPANAPHFFRNASSSTVRMLCMCTPAGQEEFFATVGVALPGRTSPAPVFEGADLEKQLQNFAKYALRYRTEILPPAG